MLRQRQKTCHAAGKACIIMFLSLPHFQALRQPFVMNGIVSRTRRSNFSPSPGILQALK